MNKYINIIIEGQDNIGVIDLGSKKTNLETGYENIIKEHLEPKLIKALEEHFDCPVKIRLTNVVSVFGHIEVRATVVIESAGADYTEEVIMEETWIY